MTNETWLTELTDWRAERDRLIRAENSWLALAGLCWLEEGENLLGSADKADVQLPDWAPGELGVVDFREGRVTLWVADGHSVTVDGANVQEAELQLDVTGQPTWVRHGSLALIAIQRGARVGLRIWDNSRAEREMFPPRKWYSADLAYHVEARIVAYDPPKPIIVPDILGDAVESGADVRLEFVINGVSCALDMFALEDGRYYLLFKDETSGRDTYPTGRYIYTGTPTGDRVILDFNRAYNPPCAFTPYATCPMAPRENILTVAIPAGERYGGGH